MKALEQIRKPSKTEQKVARKSYLELAPAIKQIHSQQAEIEIDETKQKIKIPIRALKLLSEILKAMSLGVPISIVPVATEVTTQKAAEMLGCSRPYLVKLLEEGKIPFTKVGKHRRIKLEHVLQYKQQMKADQKQHLVDLMNLDEETGLYDT